MSSHCGRYPGCGCSSYVGTKCQLPDGHHLLGVKEDEKNKKEVLMLVEEEGAVIPAELKAKIDSGEIIIVTKEQLLKREGIDLDKEQARTTIPITNQYPVEMPSRPEPTGKQLRRAKRAKGGSSFSKNLFKRK